VGKRREKARYAIPLYECVALKVYEIHRWVSSGSTVYKTDVHPGPYPQDRWEFVGAPAPIEVCRKYVKESVESYFSTGLEIQFAMSTAGRIASTPSYGRRDGHPPRRHSRTVNHYCTFGHL
jgi:hypothetical protein